MKCLWLCVLLAICFLSSFALDRPWISDVFFYWYTWDYEKELGGWIGGVYNTPLLGYYDSRTYRDNKRSLWQASEWGITHHFIDYWSPDWLGEGGVMREKVVFKAAEDLRREGYDIWMSYYQDGWNFDTKTFSNNISQKRDTYLWLQLFSSSPVLTRLQGKPFKLIYSRNGVPQTTIDHQGFRHYLRSIYQDIDNLNRDWGTNFSSFDDINMDFYAKGKQRAFSIKYQFKIWEEEWKRLEDLAQKEFGLPGMKVSFDVGYQPFMGFGYSNFAKILGGPHSYGGIFGQPHEQDVERFIQAVVAKKYDTVFLDHFKNFYHDWEIRIPGTAYPPEPLHFDRFWVGALLRYSEALLHLSWNEWWEGSNLEPCWEYGKKFCEKNLFWATLMWELFPRLRDFGKDAKVALLLNEWSFLSGEGNPEELYQTIQTLRRLNLPFDLVPDDLISEEYLSRFDVVIAPSCGTGFGYNQNNEKVEEILLDWVKGDKNRRLILSSAPQVWKVLGITSEEGKAQLPTGKDMNFFLDVGEKGDETFVTEGASSREDWGALPEGAFGRASGRLTVRWLPGTGRKTTFLLPLSPKRDLVLRFRANALWENKISVFLDEEEVGEIHITSGWQNYELRIPGEKVRDYLGNLTFLFEKANVPAELEPQRFPSEFRVCNIAMDWLQISTPNFPLAHPKDIYFLPEEKVSFSKDFLPLTLSQPYRKVFPIHLPPNSRVFSRYQTSGYPRDAVIPYGGHILYINGSLSDIRDDRYWQALLKWAGYPPPRYVEGGENVIGDLHWVGNTAIALAYNYDISKKAPLAIHIPAPNLPVAEVLSLNSDGEMFKPLTFSRKAKEVLLKDKIHYFGSYAVVFSPIKPSFPPLRVEKGGKVSLSISLENLTEEEQVGTIRLRARFPTLSSQEVSFRVPSKGSVIVRMPISAKESIDWGNKTVVFEIEGKWGKAIFLRRLVVEDEPLLLVKTKVVDYHNPKLLIHNEPNPFIQRATAKRVKVESNGRTVSVGNIEAGKTVEVALELPPYSQEGISLVPQEITLRYATSGKVYEKKETIFLALYPPSLPILEGAIQGVILFNPLPSPLDDYIVSLPWKGDNFCVKNENGLLVPSQVWEGKIYFPATVPPKGYALYYICEGKSSVPSDLKIERKEGIVKIENSRFVLAFDENKGGALVSLLSKVTQRDYAGGLFGASYGTFGEFDPQNPAITADKFIKDEITHQAEGKAKIEVLARGPVVASLLISYEDANIKAKQRIEAFSHKDFFRILAEAEPKKSLRDKELIPLEARFRCHSLNKIFPNFVGINTQESSPHFGWRQGPYVPPYITIMEPYEFRESISFILQGRKGVNDVRYGFFPPQRGKNGPRTYAHVEFISSPPRPSNIDALIKLHPGYQIVAKECFNALQQEPLVIMPKPKGEVRKTERGKGEKFPWLDTYRRERIPLRVIAKEDIEDEVVCFSLPISKEIVENSLRFVEYDEEGNLMGDKVFLHDTTTSEFRLLLDGKTPKGAQRFLFLYYAPGKGALPPSFPFTLQGDRLLNPSLEREGMWWEFSNASWTSSDAHTGKGCALLDLREGKGFSLITNRTLRLRPNGRYKVSFYAKVLEGEGYVRTNFYEEGYDFLQVGIPLINDGEWHRYEVELTTGDFPPSVQPYFRLWAIEKPQVVLIDDVEVTPLQGGGKVTIIKEKEEMLE